MKIWRQSSSPIHRLHHLRSALTGQLTSLKRTETSLQISGVDNGFRTRCY
jgi:hypothetical protein